MGGKRQANVLSALIQNFDTVEKVIETSANSSGSALEENERYLDSIQGKIDQFNNAMQAMWSNTLDSDMVKGFVNLGTILIKIIDKIGLLNAALIALSTYSMIKNKMGPIAFLGGISDLIRDVTGKAGGFIGSLAGVTAATSAYTAETLAASVANGTLSASEAASIATKNGLTLATTSLTAAEATEMLTKAGVTQAEALSIVTKLGLTKETQVLTTATIQQAIADGTLTASQGAAAMAMFGASGAAKGLTASLMGLWTALWPILAVMAGIAAIYGVVKLFDAMIVSAEEASEQLEETKNKISELESELDSLQTELDEAREKIAELTALPYLSLTQQEDLDRLEREVELLERQIALKERQLAIEEAKLVDDAEVAIKKNWGPTDKNKKDKKEINKYIDQYNVMNQDIQELEQMRDKWSTMSQNDRELAISGIATKNIGLSAVDLDVQQMDDAIREIESRKTSLATSIEEIFNDSTYSGLTYGMSDEIDAFLDDFNNAQLKWEKALDGDNSSASIIESLWGPNASEEMKAVKSEIDKIMAEEGNWASDDEKWKSKNDAIKAYIESLDEAADGYHQLDYVINELGQTSQDIADYFTVLNGQFDSSTIDGVLGQYKTGVDVLENMKSSTNFEQDWGKFFTKDDQGEFKANIDDFAEILTGMDIETQKAFANVVESAVNSAEDLSKIDWAKAISSFSISGIASVAKIMEQQWAEVNKNTFKNLDDGAISGWIDTFSELSAALEDVASSMDLLHTAQEQYNNSGRVSIKTALEIIESTDRWNEVLTITEDTIKLNAKAEDVLVQSKLNVIKAQIDEALGAVQLQLAQLGAADSAYSVAIASDVSDEAYEQYTNAMNSYSASIAGFGAALDALLDKDKNTKVFDSFSQAYNTAKKIADTSVNKTRIDRASLEQKQRDLTQQKNMLQQVGTVSTFKENYDFDKTPGDKYGEDKDSKEKEALDKFQKAMDYWENRIAANQARYEQLQSEIDLLEKQGKKAAPEYYEEQIKLEEERLWLLEQQKKEAKKHLKNFKEGSEEWWEVASQLNDIEGEIDDVTASIQDLNDAIAEVNWYKFEEPLTRFDNHTDTLETIRTLVAPNGEEDWFDDEGNWTEEGVTVAGTYIQEIEMDKESLNKVNDLLNDKLSLPYEGNEEYYKSLELGIDSEQDLYDKREELQKQGQGYAKDIQDNQQNIVDMYESQIDVVEEYIDTLIEGYNDYIDSVKEALDAERDLYEFKKNIQKQSKDIAELERRIASLSGSTNKSDIAERRKLEAELYDARESLNDTYYDHSQDALNNALDDEQSAYEETMNKFIENLRISLETATQDMDTFLGNVTTLVSLNAGVILQKYQETELPLNDTLTSPWEEAKKAVGNYSGDALDLMNQWALNGFFTTTPEKIKGSLTSPWTAGQTAVDAFKNSVDTQMKNVVSAIESNVKTASSKLSQLYQQINDTEKRATSANVSTSSNLGNNGYAPSGPVVDNTPQYKSGGDVEKLQKILNQFFGAKLSIDGVYGPATTAAVKAMKNILYKDAGYGTGNIPARTATNGEYDWETKTMLQNYLNKRNVGSWFRKYNMSIPPQMYAKGTTGTTRDEWAITDEPQFGDELTMYATPEGTLSFMRAGSTVIPADITANLVEWGKLNPDMFNVNGMPNINMISNAVNKPELNIAFDSLVKAENITEETLPAVKKLVTQELNRFTKELNYALKGKGAR